MTKQSNAPKVFVGGLVYMSADEKMEQAKNVLYQHLQAKKELTALKTKAVSVSERLEVIAEKLKPKQGPGGFENVLGEVIEKPSPHDQMTLAQCLELVNRVRTAEEQVKNLEVRVAGL